MEYTHGEVRLYCTTKNDGDKDSHPYKQLHPIAQTKRCRHRVKLFASLSWIVTIFQTNKIHSNRTRNNQLTASPMNIYDGCKCKAACNSDRLKSYLSLYFPLSPRSASPQSSRSHFLHRYKLFDVFFFKYIVAIAIETYSNMQCVCWVHCENWVSTRTIFLHFPEYKAYYLHIA